MLVLHTLSLTFVFVSGKASDSSSQWWETQHVCYSEIFYISWNCLLDATPFHTKGGVVETQVSGLLCDNLCGWILTWLVCPSIWQIYKVLLPQLAKQHSPNIWFQHHPVDRTLYNYVIVCLGMGYIILSCNAGDIYNALATLTVYSELVMNVDGLLDGRLAHMILDSAIVGETLG